ncbi:hypothetical protein CBS470a_012701 [Colletotrichum nupharicola]|nr:hypothetical protein CBS470a_012701 [Colletotrichum nupharicola]
MVTDALRDAASNLELTMGDPTFTTTTHMIDETADSQESSPPSDGKSPLPFKIQYPELEGRSLPPVEQVLKLLRLAQIEKQRFFVDCSVVDEQEFTEFCQRVYFAVNDYSILSWIIVNIGLFYMFLNLKQPFHQQLGVNYANIHEYSQQLRDNIETAMQSLRLCNDPSMEACQALALLFDPDKMIVSLYSGYVDYAIIVGDMHIELFSASALQQPQQIRVETAKTFAVKIIQTNKDIKKCNVACIDAARKALTTLVEAFNDWGNDKQTSWTMLLNM